MLLLEAVLLFEIDHGFEVTVTKVESSAEIKLVKDSTLIYFKAERICNYKNFNLLDCKEIFVFSILFLAEARVKNILG